MTTNVFRLDLAARLAVDSAERLAAAALAGSALALALAYVVEADNFAKATLYGVREEYLAALAMLAVVLA